MKATVVINTVALTALLDSGSTHNFIDTDAARRTELHLTSQGDLRVAVANGDRVTSPG
jgi:predicted aspartyl protease